MSNFSNYTPLDWYWGPLSSQYYSSARQALVSATDSQFVAWQAQGKLPTPWPKDSSGNQTTQSLQDVLTPYGLYADTSLAAIQARLSIDIDAQAEVRRLLYITPGAGQTDEYQRVYAEAQAAQTAGAAATDVSPAPSPDPYPLLRSGVGVDTNPTTGATVTKISEAAAAVVATANQWITIAAAIRNTRLTAKKNIKAATTVAAAQAAHDAVAWPY